MINYNRYKNSISRMVRSPSMLSLPSQRRWKIMKSIALQISWPRPSKQRLLLLHITTVWDRNVSLCQSASKRPQVALALSKILRWQQLRLYLKQRRDSRKELTRTKPVAAMRQQLLGSNHLSEMLSRSMLKLQTKLSEQCVQIRGALLGSKMRIATKWLWKMFSLMW